MKQSPAWDNEALLQSPLLFPLHPLFSKFNLTNLPTLQDCNTLLQSMQPPIKVQSGALLRFVPHEDGKLPFERQYEPRCYLDGEVPTRLNNLHDVLNALVWLTFPKSKAAINARHYHALTKEGSACGIASSSERGATRDVNTLLDESGVIVVYGNTELADLLGDFQWKELFWQRRQQVRAGMDFYIFGHGLYEKALQPYIGMTGQGLLLPVGLEFFNWPLVERIKHIDCLLADYLAVPEHCRKTGDLSPVPLLGIPGWSIENEHASYYDNTAYFRAGRHGKSSLIKSISEC